MADHSNSQNHDNQDTSYIKEKIVKKPRSKWFYVRRIFLFLVLAVVFGTAAGAAFAVTRGWMEQMNPQPEETTEGFTLSRDEPTQPPTTQVPTEEESLSETQEEEEDLEEQISMAVQEALENQILTQSDLLKLERLRSDVLTLISDSFVKLIAAHEPERDLFDETVENTNETFGVVVQKTDTQIFVLTDSAMLEGAESLTAQIEDREYAAAVTGTDSLTGITLVEITVGEKETYPVSVRVAELGNSYACKLGDAVIAAGSPLGVPDSVNYGYITYLSKNVSVVDGHEMLCFTSMAAAEDGRGVLMNLQGQIIGWITEENNSGMGEVTAAIGISDLKYVIEDLLAGRDTAYLGIRGQEVNLTQAEERDLAVGFYVTEVIQGSPAYDVGIQPSDIISQIGEQEIRVSGDFQKAMDEVAANTTVTVILHTRNAMGEYVKEEIEIPFASR